MVSSVSLDDRMNGGNAMDAKTILMWGDSATGKSSLITAALFDPQSRFPAIDMEQTGAAANAVRLNEHWRDLREGRPGAPTAEDKIDIAIHRRDGVAVLLRDVRGGLVDQAADAATLRTVRSAAVLLFVMDFQARDAVRQLRAIDGIWNICSNVAKGLVFTKCELHLDYDHQAWNGELDWWQEFPELRIFGSHIERFGDAVFPTSVYGYHPRSMLPALTLGEFGEIRPFNIAPRGVVRPFAWALEQIDAS